MTAAEAPFPSLPAAEDAQHEFKAAATPDRELAAKLARAASGFWNSGGGTFVIGADGSGALDEGVPFVVGRQSRRDWIDQVLSQVSPTGRYAVVVHETGMGRGTVAIVFAESTAGPHMAPDGRYYVRAGAHTLPATHFIVEAIRARRGRTRPYLRARLRRSPDHRSRVELLVIALNDVPALDVEIDLTNPERVFEQHPSLRENLPLRLGVVDRDHSFVMDYDTLPYLGVPRLGDAAPKLHVTYSDIIGNTYQDVFALEVVKSIGALQIGEPAAERIAKSVDEVSKRLVELMSKMQSVNEK